MSDQKYIKELFHKYVHKECTPEEVFFLIQYFDIDKNESVLKSLIRQELDRNGSESLMEARQKEQLYDKIALAINQEKTHRPYTIRANYTIYRIAATILLISSLALIAYMFRRDWLPSSTINDFRLSEQSNPSQPDNNKVTLTLQDGKKILLNNLNNGEAVREQGLIISKLNKDQIVYQLDSTAHHDKTFKNASNTIQVPRGSKFKVTLIDGTNVWMNSESIITFSPNFSQQERKIEINGEAYFEVSPNKAKPFRVRTPQHEISVIGTRFNVTAYPEEKTNQTTLLEGIVKIQKGEREILLAPGQQAETRLGEQAISIHTVDIEKVMAWKNGLFILDGQHLEQIMRQISRWYDVEIIYDGTVPTVVLAGMISREEPLERLLHILEKAGKINFTMEENKVIVHQTKPI